MKVVIHNADDSTETWRALGWAFKDFAGSAHTSCGYSYVAQVGKNIRVFAERNKTSIRLSVQPKEQQP